MINPSLRAHVPPSSCSNRFRLSACHASASTTTEVDINRHRSSLSANTTGGLITQVVFEKVHKHGMRTQAGPNNRHERNGIVEVRLHRALGERMAR